MCGLCANACAGYAHFTIAYGPTLARGRLGAQKWALFELKQIGASVVFGLLLKSMISSNRKDTQTTM